MKSSIILNGLFATAAFALPGTSRGSEDAVNNLEVRDTPIWAANFAPKSVVDSASAGFGRVQIQYYNETLAKPGTVNNNGPQIPVIQHDKLGGKALRIHLNARDTTTNPVTGAQMRWEAHPPDSAKFYAEGDERYFRVDFVLDPDYPVSQTKWNMINQIHQGSDDGSPPIEFDIYSNKLWVHGENAALGKSYTKPLATVKVDTKYKLVYRVKFSKVPSQSLLQVWLDDQEIVPPFNPETATMSNEGKSSYWKGATAYCHQGVPPLTIYQNNHKVGATKASVDT